MNKYYTIIDAEKRMAECEAVNIPDDMKEAVLAVLGTDSSIEEVTFFHDYREDYIVFNKKHVLCDCFESLIADMLELDLDVISDLYDMAPKSLKNTIKTLFNIMVARGDKKGGAAV